MTFYKTLILIVALSASFLTACSEPETVVNINAANSNAANAETMEANTSSPFNTTKKPEEATTNEAPTVKPVVMAYYEALKKKDDAALRKVYSSETLKSLEADMKAEGKSSLAQFITELEPAPDKPFEVRNEQIQGDVAIAEMRGGAYPNGIRIKFVKENGEWKMTNEMPAFDAPKK